MATATASRSAWSRLKSIPIQYPLSFGAGLSCAKTSGSDLLVQKVVEQRDEVDWKRNIAFGTFGLVYLGGVQYVLYVNVFQRLFPRAASFAAKPIAEKLKDVKGLAALGGQVFLDQCVHHPLLYFPVFYCTKELVTSNGNPNFKACLTNYWNNFSEDMVALWKIWVPATLVNFAFMPMHLRIPCTAATSLIWTCILSAMRGGDVAHGEDMIGNAVTGATLAIFEEGLSELFTCPVELDREMSHVVVHASGPDKVGWVSQLSREVASQGGNVTFSKMLRLGQEFVVLMHVAVPPEQVRDLIKSLNKNEELKPLNIRTSTISRRPTGKYDKPVVGMQVHFVGEDKPGMLALISEKLSNSGLAVEDMGTELRLNKNGRRDFVVNADVTSPIHLDQQHVKEIVSDLASLKDTLSLDVVDVRVHRTKTQPPQKHQRRATEPLLVKE